MTTHYPKIPRKPWTVAIALVALTWFVAEVIRNFGTLTVAVAVVAIPLVALAWHRRRTTRGRIHRLSRGSRRRGGVASTWDILRTSSWLAMRRKATVLRPSLVDLSWWRRLRTPTRAYADPIARCGMLRIWSPCEDVTLRLGGPRTGKTAELATRIIDAPGAVIATSTRTDLIDHTTPLRSKVGPVLIFNPSSVGTVASTIKWSPLDGCRNPRTAALRAGDLLGPANPGTESARWREQAQRALTVLMHAAALSGEGMPTVLNWLAAPKSADGPVMRALARSPQADVMRHLAVQFIGTNERTQSSITTSAMPAFQWVADPAAAALADAEPGESFDVARFIRDRGTLHLLGAEDGVVGPFVGALTAEIARVARQLASESPRGRLDPPMTIALDEAALVCPVPLDAWTADMGGRGVTVHIGAQSRAQLRQRWGDEGAATILNNSATVLVFGGSRDPSDLDALSKLSGEREEITEVKDPDGSVTSTSTRKVPVLSPADIANLPAHHVMVIRRGMRAAVGRAPIVWRRRDVKRAHKATPVVQPVRAAEPATAPAEDVEVTA